MTTKPNKNIDALALKEKAEAAKVSEIPVKKLIKTREVTVIREGTKIFSAIQALENHGISGAPVIDINNKLVGVITEYDLLLQAAIKDIRDVIEYNKEPLTVTMETKLIDAIAFFYKKRLKWCPVIDSNRRVLGVLNRIELLSALIKRGR
jgi:CBS domain-containing protein